MNKKNFYFEQLIKNKNIIIVGPSPNLKNKKLGSWIDSFDNVVKFNNMINSNVVDDHGSKIDILYINNFYTRKHHFINSPNRDKVKMLVIKPINNKNHYEKHNQIISTRIVKGNGISTGSLLGIIAIQDILMYQPKQLYVIGMDFYNSDDNYYPDYQLIKPDNRHSINNNIKEIRQLNNKHKNLIIDSNLQKIIYDN